MIIKCPNCGARNRVPDQTDASRIYQCGKCKANISITSATSADKSKIQSVVPPRAKKKRLSSSRNLRESWLKPPIVHPIFLGIFPILALYSQNMHELSFSDTYIALVFSVILIPLMLFLLWWIFKDARKVGLAVSVYVIFFFSYGHIVVAMEEAGIHFANRLMGVLWIIVFAIVIYLIVRTRKDLRNLTVILNVITISAVIVSSITILMYEIKRSDLILIQEPEVVPSNTEVTEEFPDIYYFIVDGYASSYSLDHYISYDNSEFINSLYDRGFSVASESKSNYKDTIHSITSSLNMEYLDYMGNEYNGPVTDERPFWQMCKNHKVWQFLKTKGYQYVQIATYLKLTGPNEYADISYWPFPSNEFNRLLLNTTWFRAIPSASYRILGYPVDEREMHYECVINQFNKLATVIESEDISQPKFVFCHVLIPHPPFVFEQDGTFVTGKIEAERSKRDNYLNQLIYCNDMMLRLVDKILLESEISPIIIMQADHGAKQHAYADLNDLAIEDQNELYFSILNAYHLPDGGSESMYDSISPVNSFRLIFNTYFGENFELLPDESYMSGFDNLYEFHIVTDFAGD